MTPLLPSLAPGLTATMWHCCCYCRRGGGFRFRGRGRAGGAGKRWQAEPGECAGTRNARGQIRRFDSSHGYIEKRRALDFGGPSVSVLIDSYHEREATAHCLCGHFLPKLSNSPFRAPPRNACHSSDVNRRTAPSGSLLL